jgi:N-acetylmuramoyl-L-alanine amidase
MAKKVYIGIGHGGSDPGAVANDVKEKNANLVIGLACAEEKERHGVEVMLSRTTDVTEGTSAKVNECNAFKPDLAADIHNNAGGGDGAEVYHSINGGTGKELANNILIEVKAVGQNSRGAKTRKGNRGDYYGFIRDTNCPAVIVECAFLDNKKDVQIIDTKAEQQAMGVAIAKGFLRQLKIVWKPPVLEEPEDATLDKKYIYRVQVGAYSKKSGADKMLAELRAAGFGGIIVKSEK